MILSILIPTIPSREQHLKHLMSLLEPQLTSEVEVLVNKDNKEKTTGKKRGELLEQSKGKYICFIDDDDEITTDYISTILEALKSEPDCVGFSGRYTINGVNEIKWRLSSKYKDCDDFSTGTLIYHRRANHLTPVKREYALLAGFPDKSNAEDKWYSERLNQYLKNEVYIEKELYHYKYQSYNKEYA